MRGLGNFNDFTKPIILENRIITITEIGYKGEKWKYFNLKWTCDFSKSFFVHLYVQKYTHSTII